MFEHYERTIAAIPEPWFMGPGIGQKYVERLNAVFASRTDKQKVDDALALGWYAFHTEENKQHRHAVRAVILAAVLMKGNRAETADFYKRQYKSMTIERLKQEFVHSFPAFFDGGNRGKWSPVNFTHPRTVGALAHITDWTKYPVPPYKFFIHGLTHPAKTLANPELVLSGRLAISAGVLSNKKPIAFTNHGLILEVPENNILTTSPSDQWFDNYAVSKKHLDEKGRPEKSVKADNGHTMAEHIIDKTLRIGGLLTPDEVIDRQGTPAVVNHFCGATPTSHNEVVICGIPDQSLPCGKTGKIRLLGVFIQINMDGTFPDYYKKSQGPRAKIRQDLHQCAHVFKVPMLYLPTSQRL